MNYFNDPTIFNTPNPFGKCSIMQIKNFEKKFSIEIPKDYKDYLCHFNGAKPVNITCFLSSDNGHTSIHHMYGLHDHEAYRLKVEKNMLVFAEDSFGNEFAINVTSGKNYGSIYFIDSELTDTEFDDESAIMISKSFHDFISSLIPEDMYMETVKREHPEIYARIEAFKRNPQI